MKQGNSTILSILGIMVSTVLAVLEIFSQSIELGRPVLMGLSVSAMVFVVFLVYQLVDTRKPTVSLGKSKSDEEHLRDLRNTFDNMLSRVGTQMRLIDLPMRLDKPDRMGTTRISVNKIVSRFITRGGGKRLVILGQPGAGKSVTLYRIGMKLVEGYSSGNFDLDYIPVYIDLSEPIQAQKPQDILIEKLNSLGLSHKLQDPLEQSKLLLMLDGLNEMPGKLVRTTATTFENPRISELLQYLDRPFKGAFIITCRVTDYEIYERSGNFPAEKIYIDPLKPRHIRDISERHFASKQKAFLAHLCLPSTLKASDRMWNDISTFTRDNIRARIQLMQNLQSLHMMIELFHKQSKDNRGEDPSGNIFRLYEEYIDYLYKERARQGGKLLPKKILTYKLGILARDMMRENMYSCDIQWAEKRFRSGPLSKFPYTGNEYFIREAQRINLLVNSLAEDGNKSKGEEAQIRFVHQTLYEYFAEPHIQLNNGSVDDQVNTLNRLGTMGTFSRLKMFKIAKFYMANRNNVKLEQAGRTAIVSIALAYNARAGTKLILLIFIESFLRTYKTIQEVLSSKSKDFNYYLSRMESLHDDFELIVGRQARAGIVNMIMDVRHDDINRARGIRVKSDPTSDFVLELLNPELFRSKKSQREDQQRSRNEGLIADLEKTYIRSFSDMEHHIGIAKNKPLKSLDLLEEIIVELFEVYLALDGKDNVKVNGVDFVIERTRYIEKSILKNAAHIRDDK